MARDGQSGTNCPRSSVAGATRAARARDNPWLRSPCDPPAYGRWVILYLGRLLGRPPRLIHSQGCRLDRRESQEPSPNSAWDSFEVDARKLLDGERDRVVALGANVGSLHVAREPAFNAVMDVAEMVEADLVLLGRGACLSVRSKRDRLTVAMLLYTRMRPSELVS